MPRDAAGDGLAIQHGDLADIEPGQFRRGGEARRAGAENDDVALDHGAILPSAIAATCALQ
jgi:hypothetical protein